MHKHKQSRKEGDNVLISFGKHFFPSRQMAKLRKLFLQAGYKELPYSRISITFFTTLLIAVFWYVYIVIASGMRHLGWIFILATCLMFIIIFEIVLLFASFVVLRFYLSVKIFNRVQSIEQNLPLFLREFSTNLKAGREFVDALEDSLTPELGALNDDIADMVVRIRSGKMIEHVLKEYTLRYDSYAINESFEIILDAYTGGGGLSEIIDKIASNLDVIHYLKKNAVASVSNYIIFMTIVSIVIAPLLFALSHNLLWLVESLVSRVFSTGSSAYVSSFIRPLDISFSDFRIFSAIGVVIISGSAACIIGIIRRGSFKGAAALVVFYSALSLAVYFISLMVLKGLFTALFTPTL